MIVPPRPDIVSLVHSYRTEKQQPSDQQRAHNGVIVVSNFRVNVSDRSTRHKQCACYALFWRALERGEGAGTP